MKLSSPGIILLLLLIITTTISSTSSCVFAQNTPQTPPTSPDDDDSEFPYTPGVVFVDLIYTLTTPELLKQDPINNDHLFRVNLGRSGYRGESLSVNFALPTLDLSNYRKNSSTIISSNAEGTVPIYDNVLLMLYCDTSKYVDEYGLLQSVPAQFLQSTNFFTGDASSITSLGQSKNSILSVNYCNTVNVYLKLPGAAAARVQWLFQKVDAPRASSSDVLNFTETNHRAQLLKGDLAHSLIAHTGWQRILWGEKYCRDVIDECMFHAFSCSKSYQKTKIVDHSEAFPVYNLGYRFYPATEFRNLWTAISSPTVAEIMPSEADLADSGPFSNRMSSSFINLENNAWLMTINRLPPSRVLAANEAFTPADQATILMQFEAQPSAGLPEAFVTAGTMFSVIVCTAVCLFLIICKAIVPRILYLRRMESEGVEEALERIDNELIERFEQQRQQEESRNALIARLGRVTGAPLTPDDVDALEEWTKLPVGDMIQAAIVEERKRAMQEKLATATDKFAALPRVLFARALRLVDKSLFSRTGYNEAKEAELQAEADIESGEVEGYDNQVNNSQQQEFSVACDTASSSPRHPNVMGQEQKPRFESTTSFSTNSFEPQQQNNNNLPLQRSSSMVIGGGAGNQQQQHKKKKRPAPKLLHDPLYDEGDNIADADLLLLMTDATKQAAVEVKDSVVHVAGAVKNGVVLAATETVHLVETGASKVVEGGAILRDKVVGVLKNAKIQQQQNENNNNNNQDANNKNGSRGVSPPQSSEHTGFENPLSGRTINNNNNLNVAAHYNNSTSASPLYRGNLHNNPNNNYDYSSDNDEHHHQQHHYGTEMKTKIPTLDVISPEDRRRTQTQTEVDDEIVEITPEQKNNTNNHNDEKDEDDAYNHSTTNNNNMGENNFHNSSTMLASSGSIIALNTFNNTTNTTTTSSSSTIIAASLSNHHNQDLTTPPQQNRVRPPSMPPIHISNNNHPPALNPQHVSVGSSINGHNVNNFHFHSPTTISGLTIAAAAGASPHHHNQKFFEQQVNQQLQKNALNSSGNNFLDTSGNLGGGLHSREKSTSLAPGTVVQMTSQRRFRIAAVAAATAANAGGGGSGRHSRSMSTNSQGGLGAPGGGSHRRMSSMSPGMAHSSPGVVFEHVLERHLQEDRRLLDTYKDELLPTHSFDIFSTETRPEDVPHCRHCGDVLPFIDLFAPCNCTSNANRYIHRSCLEAERRLDAFADGGRHAEFCFRCRICRTPYRIAPNSISVFGAVPMKSPLAQTINKLMTNPIAPMLAMWLMVWVCGYLMKFIAATMTLDYINTDWSALRIYHWVLGAFFLLSFSLCEWSLRPFFEVFSPKTKRIIIMLVAGVAPLLFGYVGHFCMKLIAMIAWSWESFYGLGVAIEFLLFAYVVPKILLILAKGAGSLYDRLPFSVQRLLQKIVP